MHEYSLVLSLIERVEQEAAAHRATEIRRVHVSVGELSGVEAELLASAYEIARETTQLKTTELVLTKVAARWMCSVCERDIEHQKSLFCETCGAQGKLVQGGDILFESVELEVPSE